MRPLTNGNMKFGLVACS